MRWCSGRLVSTVWNGPYRQRRPRAVRSVGQLLSVSFFRGAARPMRSSSYGADGREGGTGTAADISNVERSDRKSGFTLIEVLAVMLIIALMASLVDHA